MPLRIPKVAGVAACSLLLANAAPSEDMQFTFASPFEQGQTAYISASGRITADTPARFRAFVAANRIERALVSLDSGGGDLRAGLDLGREIRARRFETVLDLIETEEVTFPPLGPEPPRGTGAHVEWQRESLGRALAMALPRVRVAERTCLSACAYAFLGGVTRRIRSSELSDDLFGERPDTDPRQDQLGFHQFDPNINAQGGSDGPTLDGLRAASVQITTSMLAAYLNEMGVAPVVLDFANRAPVSSGQGRFTFPTIAELRRANVIVAGHFEPFQLDSEQNGIALVSRYSLSSSFKKQIAIVCLQGPAGRHPYLIVSTGPEIPNASGPAPRLNFDTMSAPQPADYQGSWTLTLFLDERLAAAGTNLPDARPGTPVVYSGMNEPDGRILYGANFAFREAARGEGRIVWHYGVRLDDAAFHGLGSARAIRIRYRWNIMRFDADFDVGLDARQLSLVMNNCVAGPRGLP